MSQRNRISVFGGAVVAVLYMLFYFYDYFLQTSFSILPATFLTAHHITDISFGLLSGAFFYGYILFQIPLGYCLDRIGLKPISILCATLCVIGSLLFYFCHGLLLLLFGRFVIGAGTACACVMAVYAVSTWLAPQHFAIGVGSVQVAGCLGSIFGQALESFFIASFGWRATVFTLLGFGVLLLLIYSVLPRRLPGMVSAETVVTLRQLPKVIVNRQIIIICLLGFIAWAPVSVLAASWLVRLLHQQNGWSHHMAASLVVSFWVGLAVASLLIGKVSDWLRSRKMVVVIAFVVQFACGIVLAGAAHLSAMEWMVLLLLLGGAAAVQTFSFILTAEAVPTQALGAAAALVNLTAASSGGVLNPLFGLMVALTHSYHLGLWLFPVLSVLGIFLTVLFLKETYQGLAISHAG